MSNIKTLSTFKTNWVVKSIPYNIKFSKAFRVTKFDTIFCTIVNEMGGSIDKNDLASLLGFNIISDKRSKKYGDTAEKEIFDFYLHKVLDFKLLEINENYIQITEEGIESLEENLKYKYFSAKTKIIQNVTLTENDKTLFSFKNSYGLKNELFSINSINRLEKCEDSFIQQKIDLQLFENDIFQGEIVEAELSQAEDTYTDFTVEVSLLQNDDGTKILSFVHHLEDCFIINHLVETPENFEIKNQLIRKGEFHHYLSLNKPIDSNILKEYLDLWDWRKLADNDNVVWKDKNVFTLFSKYADRSTWEIISSIVSLEYLAPILKQFEDFWSWTTLTERFDNNFLKNYILKYPWDFEVVSHKEIDLVLGLLNDKNLHGELWDWVHLSDQLPENFIVENIQNFPWDYYKITTSRKEIFKEAFNVAFTEKSTEVLRKSWNWKYISENINLQTLRKRLQLFAEFIDWEIVLKRFFTDIEITKNSLNDASFINFLQTYAPKSFMVKDQSYEWSSELINFFDKLDLIQWETLSFIKGFDQNTSVNWDKSIFQNFNEKINTEVGFSTVSSQITDYKLLTLYPDFKWDWEAISKNKTIVNNSIFIIQTLQTESFVREKLVWGSIFENYPVSFWNSNIEGIQKSIVKDNNELFYKLITAEQEFEFIVASLDFNWDWNYLSEKTEMTTVIDSLNNEGLLNKWNWEVLTPRFTKTQIYDHLEDLSHLWHWQHIINQVFEYKLDLKLEDGGLNRIAQSISGLEEAKRSLIWNSITSVYPIEILFEYINKTKNNSLYAWDWTIISGNRHIKSDLATVNDLKNNLNWTVFSANPAINRMFDLEEYENNYKEYLHYTKKYLKSFSSKWDWGVLSRNQTLNWNRIILKSFYNQAWDWDYLSESGKFLSKSKNDSDDYLVKIISKFPKINLELVSKRTDVKISDKTILETKNLNWDWKALSLNSVVRFTSELLLELHQKDWDWEVLSLRSDVPITNKMLLELQTKTWDWRKLSSSSKLLFNQEFLLELIDKPWNWTEITRNPSFTPTQTILPKIKHFDLDWDYISAHQELPINREILSNFGQKLNWKYITQHPNLDVSKIDLVSEFQDSWDWKYLSTQSAFPLNESTIKRFENFLDWEFLSSNTNLHFDKPTILQYKKQWNWNRLRKNIKVRDVLGDFVEETIDSSSDLKFLTNIARQDSNWKNSIYHFTHIENALEIIKNRKIQSRNKASILGDAAGNVINLRDDAHAYARFYFRPHTPTQFYNEFLGKSTYDGFKTKQGNWVSWYEKARGLGFPKCPIPIFFRFSLKEVIFDEHLTACISNGNMQTKSTRFGPIDNMINLFGYENLYYETQQYSNSEDYRKYRAFSQQEFLIKDELDFKSYQNFEIVCATILDCDLLKRMLGPENSDIFSKIVVNDSFYNFDNARVNVDFSNDEISINSGFEGDGVFSLETKDLIDRNNINEGDVQSLRKSEIFFKSHLSISKVKEPFKIKFIDESNNHWVIYKSK